MGWLFSDPFEQAIKTTYSPKIKLDLSSAKWRFYDALEQGRNGSEFADSGARGVFEVCRKMIGDNLPPVILSSFGLELVRSKPSVLFFAFIKEIKFRQDAPVEVEQLIHWLERVAAFHRPEEPKDLFPPERLQVILPDTLTIGSHSRAIAEDPLVYMHCLTHIVTTGRAFAAEFHSEAELDDLFSRMDNEAAGSAAAGKAYMLNTFRLDFDAIRTRLEEKGYRPE